jgi:heavy metal sensor kinase
MLGARPGFGLSFRMKLTVCYTLSLGLLFAVFGYSAHLAMRRSSIEAVDHALATRLGDVRNFLTRQAGSSKAELLDELQEQTDLGLGGGLLEVWDHDGELLYRSARAAPGDFGPQAKAGENVLLRGAQVVTPRGTNRLAAGVESVGSHRYFVRVAQPMEEFEESQKGFDRLLLYLAPMLLAVSVAVGLIFSRRALRPVQKMSRDAHRISIGNLSQRLDVPAGNDEIQKLAITLNEMLGRIDGEVQRMLQFTEDASHELRTPLTLIHSAAEFSLRGKRTEGELLDALRSILRESARTARLIGDLLTLARVGELRLETVDLRALIGSTVARLADFARQKRILVTLDLPDEEVYANADESSLGRLLLILLDNALKYTDEGGRVAVVLTQQAQAASVIFADTGIGIAGKDLPHIWDRFWRADKVRSRNSGGTGLGLAIARSIANQHGAEIRVESRLGEGSRFHLHIRAVGRPLPEQGSISELVANGHSPEQE